MATLSKWPKATYSVVTGADGNVSSLKGFHPCVLVASTLMRGVQS